MESEEAKIFVAGLPREVEEDALAQHFSKYGAVLRAFVIRDRITRNSRGHGFVWFSDPSSANKAIDDNEHTILGKTVIVKRPTPHVQVIVKRPTPRTDHTPIPQDPPVDQQVNGFGANGGDNGVDFRTRKIFVGGLPASLTRDEFKRFFERFGETTDVVIMQDNVTRKPRGFGFVTFESENSVKEVMQKNYYNLNGRYVEVKRAVPKKLNEYVNGSCYSNGHVGTGPESSQTPGSYFPYYPAYGPLPSYGVFSGYSKPGFVPYVMCNYWGPYSVIPRNPSYVPAPVYVNGFVGSSGVGNGFVGSSGVGIHNQNGSEMTGVHNQVDLVDRKGIEAQIREMKIEDSSPRIGDVKLDGDSSGWKGGKDGSSC
ncbi:DAZ-associated protein 1-like [Punica granatum]|uniref:DAZ-associated protein 1-like n=2 Tax=Punica granatum TaxID=22663 RepID=A0A6P8CAH3_PUNGR|nr:DAZ-associated protein 1-like [Punica granatum]XP_031379935.1 DAZ-associated protein 1-like [Punica granatum]XP_031380008.1 DAZ-associated protein 1-like [Punica granatum]OWM80624.1 hypothetical protein CDL15_Pgr006654 [Punica granatum]PKI72472.1 hypothetical protein CRG98_007139 [Punica granatum]